MGMVLLKKRKLAEAMDHARIVIAKNPKDYNALKLIALIETRKNPFRGGSYRAALWMRRPVNRIVAMIGIIGISIGATEAFDIGLPVCLTVEVRAVLSVSFSLVALSLLPTYLQISSTAFTKYVTKNYLSKQSLRKDF